MLYCSRCGASWCVALSPWWWRRQTSPKRRSTSTRLHGTIFRKAVIFIIDAVRTWILAWCVIFNLWQIVDWKSRSHLRWSLTRVPECHTLMETILGFTSWVSYHFQTWVNICDESSPWWWRYASLKRRTTSTRLHGAILHKADILISKLCLLSKPVISGTSDSAVPFLLLFFTRVLPSARQWDAF
jgi:hypothetical protein